MVHSSRTMLKSALAVFGDLEQRSLLTLASHHCAVQRNTLQRHLLHFYYKYTHTHTHLNYMWSISMSLTLFMAPAADTELGRATDAASVSQHTHTIFNVELIIFC